MGLFDILGPVMVGPSSSHTAGACRIGLVARLLLGQTPRQVRVGLHGSFAAAGNGHGTHWAIAAGLCGLAPDDVRLVHGLDLARELGIDLVFENQDLGPLAHPNSAALDLSDGTRRLAASLSSIGGGDVRLWRLQNMDLTAEFHYHTLLTLHGDRPGVVSEVARHLAEHQINIAQLRLSRDRRGDRALMVVECDDALPSELIDDLALRPGYDLVRQVPKFSL